MYLLSVCIPTRNRPVELLKTIKSIEDQIINNNAEKLVEIVITDNTDIKDLKISTDFSENSNINYIDNKQNIGYARNINKLILNAKGKYIWLLSDDDIVCEDAIKFILQYLNSYKEINYLTFFSGASSNGVVNGNFYFENLETDYFINGKDFLNLYWISVIFISINIFDRKKMIEHATRNNLFENVNDTYQNSLLCISFIDTFGCTQVIPKTLLIDSYDTKTYMAHTSINVPVIQYFKLLLQLERLGLHYETVQKIKTDVNSHILMYGLEFIIRKIEINDEFDYAIEYKKIIRDAFHLDIKLMAGIIFLLLKIDKRLCRLILKIIFRLKRRDTLYDEIKISAIEWNKRLMENKIMNSY